MKEKVVAAPGKQNAMTLMESKAYGVIVAAFFTISIAYSVRYGYGMLLPGMLETMQITKTEAGIISAAYFGAYTVCSPLLGLLSDRSDPRILLTIFTSLLAGGAVMMAAVSTVVEASLVFGLVGVGHAACWTPVVSLVQQWVSDRYRGTALSIATLGSSIGIAFWSIWLPIVVARWSYRMGWMQLGVFGFFVVGLNFLLIKRSPEAAKRIQADFRAEGGRYTWTDYFRLLGSRTLWIVGSSYACIGFVVLVPFTFLGVYAKEEMGLHYAVATSFFTVLALSGIIGKIVLGMLSDRLSRLSVMATCGLLLGAGSLGVVHIDGIVGKYFCIALIGTGFGAVWPVYAAAAIDYFPRSQAGSVIGLWTVFMGIGSMLSPVICGWSIDVTDSYDWAFHMGAGVSFLSAVLLWPLWKERCKDRR